MKHALALPTSEMSHKRENTSSSTLSAASTDTEKSIAGFQKIVAELTDENGDLKQRIQDLEAEMQTLLADNQQLAAECSILREVSTMRCNGWPESVNRSICCYRVSHSSRQPWRTNLRKRKSN